MWTKKNFRTMTPRETKNNSKKPMFDIYGAIIIPVLLKLLSRK